MQKKITKPLAGKSQNCYYESGSNQITDKPYKGVVYLHDSTEKSECQGRDLRDLARKRRSNDRIMPWMRKHLGEASYSAMAHCGDYLVMLEDETRTHRKLDVGYFCRQRLCSGCAWRSAVKSAQCVSAIAAKLIEEGRVMCMATLTVPNVTAEDLRATIQHIGRAWVRLLKRTRYAAWADAVRKIEITYNAQRKDYHPHMHVVLFVPKSYFKGGKYVSQVQLLQDWREVTGQPEITQVDIRRCYDKGTSSAILEVAKYSAKASDYAQSEAVCDTMYAALHHTRTMTYSGRCKELRDEYQRGRLRDYTELDTTKYTMRVVYVWQRTMDAYTEHDVQRYDMDAEELERLHRDEKRLADYACAQAKRKSELHHLFATAWVRELEKMDEKDWLNVEVIE